MKKYPVLFVITANHKMNADEFYMIKSCQIGVFIGIFDMNNLSQSTPAHPVFVAPG